MFSVKNDPNTQINGDTSLTWGELDSILEDVNKIRIALGIGQGNLPELPKGMKGDPQMCVLAKALSNGWEVEVESELRFMHSSHFEKPFDWEKTVNALTDMGFDAHYDSDTYTTDCYCYCGSEFCEQENDPTLIIELTDGMQTLIQSFDDGFLPFLVLDAD